MISSYEEYGINGAGRVLIPGTLRGYRAWRMDDKGRLWSIHSALPGAESMDFWTIERREAQCRLVISSNIPSGFYFGGCRSVPGKDCRCGIYASYSAYGYQPSIPKFWHEDESGRGSYFIHGSIKASGRMVLGETGFRAQYAQIESLWGWGSRWVARNMEIPWFMTRRRFLGRYPASTMDGILPRRME